MEETLKIIGLNSFQRRGWIKPSRFKNKNYYSTSSIIECIKYQLGEYPDIHITNQNKEWETMWV